MEYFKMVALRAYGQTTENDCFEQAWEDALEDKAVDPIRKAEYGYELVFK